MNFLVAAPFATKTPPPRLTQHRLYIAALVDTFWTPDYEAALSYVRAAFPSADLHEARHLFATTADWLARWDATLEDVDGVVLIVGADGLAGRGCRKEVADARAIGLPVWLATPAGLSRTFALLPIAGGRYKAKVRL